MVRDRVEHRRASRPDFDPLDNVSDADDTLETPPVSECAYEDEDDGDADATQPRPRVPAHSDAFLKAR